MSVYERVFVGISHDNTRSRAKLASSSSSRGSIQVSREEKAQGENLAPDRGKEAGCEMVRRVCHRRVRRDCSGGIEGLPLQLLIMVVVAGLGLTIIMGWMNSISAPHSIGEVFVNPSEITVHDEDGDGLYTRDGVTITVTVTDQSGDRLEGATVLLDGANVRTKDGGPAQGVTDSSGQVVLSNLKVEQFGSRLTTIVVTIAKGDYGVDSSYQVPVIPS